MRNTYTYAKNTSVNKGNIQRAEIFTEETGAQLRTVFKKMENPVILRIYTNRGIYGRELTTYMKELSGYTDKLKLEIKEIEESQKPYVEILRKDGSKTGIRYMSTPKGSEFSAYIISLYNVAGPGQAIEKSQETRIKEINKKVHTDIFVSADCRLCQDLIIAWQKIASLSEYVSTDVLDINRHRELMSKYAIKAVPCYIINGKHIKFGKRNISELLKEIEEVIREEKEEEEKNKDLHLLATKCIMKLYHSVFYINLRTKTYSEISTLDKEIKNSGNVEEYFNSYIEKNVKEKHKRMMKQFTDLNNVTGMLIQGNTIEAEYVDNYSGWCRAIFIPAEYDSLGSIQTVLYCSLDINQQKNTENMLKSKIANSYEKIHELRRDSLSGLWNRDYGIKLVKERLKKAKQGIYCLLDCDHFKSINDTYGHIAGDKVIAKIAECISSTFSEEDIMFRLGGDEFTIFSENIWEKGEIEKIYEKLFKRISSLKIAEIGSIKISVSAGIVIFKRQSAEFEELYRKADHCMYQSKEKEGSSCSISEY